MRVKEGQKDIDIINAAIRVFADQGFHKAKISDIADEAGVATGSIYIYYESKLDLLNKIFEQLWGEILNKIEEMNNNLELSPVEKLQLQIDIVFSLFSNNPSLAIVFVNEQNTVALENNNFRTLYDKFLDIGEDIIKDGMAKNYFSKEIDLTVLRHFTFGALRNSLHQWARNPERIPLPQLMNQIKLILINGIAKKQ